MFIKINGGFNCIIDTGRTEQEENTRQMQLEGI